MIEEVAGAAIEGLEVIGSFGESSSRRRQRPGCAWLALTGVILAVIGFVVAVALLRS